MFPLHDDIQSQKPPLINFAMIGLCVVAFLIQMKDPKGFVDEFGMIPLRISQPTAEIIVERPDIVDTPSGPRQVMVQELLPQPRFAPVTTLLSCIFLHGSLMHLLGNMWFLYVFGDNVEDRLGSFLYLLFYLCSGLAASLTHYAFQPESPIPTIGASGAVAGVMGAYMWLYPHARVLTLIPIFFILQTFIIPAPVFLGIWFVIQLAQGSFSMGSIEAAGVAWWAHAGGFAFGFIVAWFVGRSSPRQPRVRVVSPLDY